MKWGVVGRRRLLKLADHLESGKLGHEKFDFSVINIGPFDIKGCGWVGCALGELPIVFPRQWRFTQSEIFLNAWNPLLKSKSTGNVFSDAMKFFGITEDEAHQLFAPNSFRHRPWAKKVLGDSATSRQVAGSIRKFITWKDDQTKQEAA